VTIFGPPTILTWPNDKWEKGKTKEMEIPGKTQIADSYRRLLENPNFTGNSSNWKSHHGKNSADTRDARIVGGVGSVVERRSLADVLSLSCARPAADG